MEVKGWYGSVYKFCEWVMRLAYVNLLWILFTVMGLVVFGLFPATAGMFTVVRKWLQKDFDIPIFKTFWTTFKSGFLKLNVIGLIYMLIGMILYFDLRYFVSQTGMVFTMLTYVTAVAVFLYMSALLFFFPIYVHYNLNIFQYLKYSFLIPFSRPVELLIMGIVTISILFILGRIPSLIPMFSGSLISLLIMYYAMNAFKKLNKTNEKKEQAFEEVNTG